MTAHLGFTGTRRGLTAAQLKVIEGILSPFTHVHHGLCVDADAQVHHLAQRMGLAIIGHPP